MNKSKIINKEKNMINRIKILLLLAVVGLIMVPGASARPGETRACNLADCHVQPTTINITAGPTSTFTVNPGQVFTVDINWSGGNQAGTTEINWPTNFTGSGVTRNNTQFNPTPRIPVSVLNTLSGTNSSVLTAPATIGNYLVRVHASRGSNATVPRETDFKDIAVTVLNPFAVNISPSNQTVLANQIFTVNITIDPAGNLTNSVGVDISFNSTLVTVSSVAEGDFLSRGGATAFNSNINNGAGTVTNINGNIVAATGNVTTAGTFATITFRATNAGDLGTSPINLTRANISSPTPVSQIPATVTNGTVTVAQQPVLTTITVMPATAQLAVGGTQKFNATARDQNNNPMAGINITWASNNTTVGNVTPLNLLTDANGNATTTFTSATPGTALVNATNTTVSGNATVIVTTAPPVLTNITVTPATITLSAGVTTTFTATATNLTGAPMPNVTITWSSSNTTVGTVTPLTAITNASGMANTTFNATVNGTAMVNATNLTVKGTANVTVGTVTAGALNSIKVTPANAPLTPGGTQIFTATARDLNGIPLQGINITWTSSNTTIGSVVPLNAITNASGMANTTFTAGTVNGIAMVNATNATVKGTAIATVAAKQQFADVTFVAGAGTGTRGGFINVSVNVTNLDPANQSTLVVVVSGVAADGSSLVGTATVFMPATVATIPNVPVIVTIPTVKPPGSYSLFVTIYRIAEFPSTPQITKGPFIATVV